MRPATPAERKAVTGFLEAMDEGLAARVGAGYELAVTERDGIVFAVLTTPEALALPPAVLAGSHAGGLAIGTIADGEFNLDLQGAVLAAQHTKAQVVRVTEHAARLFLYGRNILGESVEQHDQTLERGDACIVANPRGEAMGLGIVVGPLSGKREAVKPIVDLGTYLRDEDEGDE